MNIERVRDACRTNLHFLCTEILHFKDWDEVHDDTEIFLARPSSHKLLLIPRGHLKTSMVTVAHSIQRLLRDFNERILIANQVWDKSRSMLSEIKQFLTTKSELPKIFGPFVSDRWREDDIVIAQRTVASKTASISTTGVDAEQTSAHYSTIFNDDLQGLQNSMTKEQRDKVKRFRESEFDLLDPGGDMLDIGTRWHLDDVYSAILENEKETTDVMIRQVVENGKLIFPRKFNLKLNPITKKWVYSDTPTLEYIAHLKKTKGASFYSQYMNNPIDEENQLFKRGYFRTYQERPDRLFVAMTMDPALAAKQDGDYFVIMVAGMDYEGDIYVLDRVKGRWTPSQAIDNIFNTYLKWRPQVIGLESMGFQRTLKFAIEEAMRKKRIFFPITELVHAANQTKEFRIKGLEPLYASGKIKHAPWMESLEDELLSFPKGKHDDEIDALAMQLEVLMPGSRPLAMPANPLSWAATAARARRGMSPYQNFFRETVRPS